MNVYLVNESTALSDVNASRIAAALDWQAVHHFNPAWGTSARCFYLPGGADAKIPSGRSVVLHMLDTSDQQGALGYHDENGAEVPYARVFVQTAELAGDRSSEVASHEMMELVVDPHVNLSALTGDGKRLYAFEVADAVQGNPYKAPNGWTVADFVLPNYFDPRTKAETITDFRGAIRGPFTLAPRGYSSVVDMTNPSAGWSQVFGSERTSLPAWSTRAGQR